MLFAEGKKHLAILKYSKTLLSVTLNKADFDLA